MMQTNFNILLLVALMDAASVTPTRHCLPGQATTRNATTGDTYCQPCPPGTFSKKGRRCLLCSVCHQGQTVVRRCRSNGNTVCRCAQGTYLKGGAICKTCSDCPLGTIQTRGCEHNLDRACRSCPKGLTTNSTNDRVCVAVRTRSVIPATNNVVVRHLVDWWIFLFIPVVVVVVGTCAAIYYWRCRKKNDTCSSSSKKKRLARKAELYELEEDSYPEAVHFVSKEVPPVNHRMVRELPAHLYEELGVKLNNKHPRNWVYLAGMLGFSRDQIRYLELTPRDSTQNLINDWSSKSQSTVYNLYVALTNMHRVDAAKIIENYVYR